MVSSLFCHHTEWKSLIPSPHRLHLTRYGLMVLWRWKDIHKFIVGNFKPLWSISSLWSLRVTLCNNTTTNSWMHVFPDSKETSIILLQLYMYLFVYWYVYVWYVCKQPEAEDTPTQLPDKYQAEIMIVWIEVLLFLYIYIIVSNSINSYCYWRSPHWRKIYPKNLRRWWW